MFISKLTIEQKPKNGTQIKLTLSETHSDLRIMQRLLKAASYLPEGGSAKMDADVIAYLRPGREEDDPGTLGTLHVTAKQVDGAPRIEQQFDAQVETAAVRDWANAMIDSAPVVIRDLQRDIED